MNAAQQYRYDKNISCAKAICIILMVVGHSGCPKLLHDFIYLFHMPCFFLISGYLFKEKYLDEPVLFLKNKIKNLWWPFVKWSILYTLLHNIFTNIHLYQNYYTISDIVRQFFHILTMTGSEQLLGGFWFLKELLYASILSFIVIKLSRMIFKSVNNLALGLCLSILFVFLSYIIGILPFNIPTINSQTMLSTSFFISGYTLKNCHFPIIGKTITTFFSLLLLVIVTPFFSSSMQVKGWETFLYFPIALIGSIGVLSLSNLVKGNFLRRSLDYIGKSTLYILIFHFLCFKIVSLSIVKWNGYSIERLSEFPVLESTGNFAWITYSIAGVLISLLLCELSKKTAKISKKAYYTITKR